MSSDGRLTPYNDQPDFQKINNLVDQNDGCSGFSEEDDDAAYIESKRNIQMKNERSRNDTIPEEATISLEDINSDPQTAQKSVNTT